MNILKDNMVENIENLIQRDGKIEIIAEKSLSLSTLSHSYKKNATKVKQQQQCKRYSVYGIGAIICIMIVLIIVLTFTNKSADSEEDDMS